MFGDQHILRIGSATQRELVPALYLVLCSRFVTTDQEEYAGELAAAVSMFLLGNPATEPKHIAFREQNAARIKQEAQALSSDSALCEVLSGAAYNIGYGHYVHAGGSRLMNRFLGYIRLDRSINSAADSTMLAEFATELNQKSPSILRFIQSLKALGLWHSRAENPNEVEQYQAVHSLAVSAGVPFGKP